MPPLNRMERMKAFCKIKLAFFKIKKSPLEWDKQWTEPLKTLPAVMVTLAHLGNWNKLYRVFLINSMFL